MNFNDVIETGVSTVIVFVSVWVLMSSCIFIKLFADRYECKTSGCGAMPYRKRDFVKSSFAWSIVLPFPLVVGGVVYLFGFLKTRMIKI